VASVGDDDAPDTDSEVIETLKESSEVEATK
jgi:hypothetical protein